MSPAALRAVSDVSFEAFTAAFNRAYSDYFTPIMMTARSFRALMARDDLVPEASVAALEGDTIVGMGLLGIRATTGWIGGMGVVPERRRQGIGRQMIEYLIERARERHLNEILLEVIEANRGARALYLQAGFEDVRHLLILSRPPDPLPDRVAPYRIAEQSPGLLLSHFEAFHDVPNCWQRGVRSLRGLASQLQGWAAYEHGNLMGYALGWANTHEIRLADLATRPGSDRSAVATALLEYLHQQNPDAYGSGHNIAEDDPALPAFFHLGYTISFRQIEMRLTLP